MGLLDEMDRIRSDIAFVRASRNFKILTTAGDIPLRYSPGAQNAIIDLRSLSASGQIAASQIPDPTGHAGEFLLTDGAVPYWGTDPEVDTWKAGALAASGTFTSVSLARATGLISAIKADSFDSKVIEFWPLFGGNLATARMPIRDKLGVGIATNNNFVDADFSESSGLHGNAVDKSLGLGFKPSQLGAIGSNNGGLGFFVQTPANPGNFQIGIFSTASGGEIYALALDADNERFWWGDGNSVTGTNNSAIKAHYYGQRASPTDRKLFRNGVLIASDTDSGVRVAGIGDRNATLLDLNGIGGNHSADVAGFAYATDGTLTDTEVANFHTLLQTYLIGPTGR